MVIYPYTYMNKLGNQSILYNLSFTQIHDVRPTVVKQNAYLLHRVAQMLKNKLANEPRFFVNFGVNEAL